MRVLFGAGIRTRAREELTKLGATRIVTITTPGRSEHAEELGTPILALAQPQVPHAVVVRALDQLGDADAILTYGGGTATGLGKALAHHRELIFGAIPTTYAGSEMTDIWATTDAGTKTTARDPRVLPQLVVYDPERTADLPIAVTITSGLNAMAHAVDASWNDPGDGLLADCARAIDGWVQVLPKLVASPRDVRLRTQALRAAQRCGIALQRGTMGLQHQLAHLLGALGLPHAETHAVLLPHVLHYNRRFAPLDARELFELMQNIGAPTKLAKTFSMQDVIERTMRDPYPNPEPMDEARLRDLLERAALGRPPV